MLPYLNLLPFTQKQELKRTRTLLLIHEVILLIFIAVVFGSAILFTARILLEQKFREVIVGSIPGNNKIIKLNRDIKNLNQRLAILDQSTSSLYSWSPILIEFAEKTPSNIQLLSLEINDQGIAKIKGLAKTRDSLISFRTMLEQSPFMQKTTLPLNFLLAEQDIEFIIEAKLNMEKLKMGHSQ